MITGAHSILYSTNPEADRGFLKDVLGLPHVDVGGGWLIFGLPPAEVAVHPSEKNDVHELYLLCDDVEAFVAAVAARGLACSSIQPLSWGRLTHVSLPGGGRIGVYQPRHARPRSPSPSKAGRSRRAAGRPKAARKPKARRKVAKRSPARRSQR
jgi:hypothetical protein